MKQAVLSAALLALAACSAEGAGDGSYPAPAGSGASIVNIHSGQPDQRRVIEFYATHVLPKLPQPV